MKPAQAEEPQGRGDVQRVRREGLGEDELPPLLRKTTTTNEYELKRKLAEQGKSYESMKEAFRKKMLARDFLNAKIHNKITADLSEQRAYYNEHLKDYDQPARFTWREIEISFAKNPNRAEARAKADAILARLLRDEDFGEIARTQSDGPTASRGGLYPDMTPGSYGIPVVNDELNRLPVGQVSTVLEAPSAYHIVRVESRREAGPLGSTRSRTTSGPRSWDGSTSGPLTTT